MKFCSIASGSNGNCIYIGAQNTQILIDAGLSGKEIETGLNSINVAGKSLDAIFITHEHSDHIHGAGIISRRFDVPIFATRKTWIFFERHGTIGKIAEKNKQVICAEERISFKDLSLRAFHIPHDASEPVGYSVEADGKKISVATDIGHPTDDVKQNIAGSDILLIESNHDIDMLRNGRYPKALKDRVMGNYGHLSNVQAGQLIAEIMNVRLKHIFLGHLSEENNRPLIALDTVSSILMANKIKIGKDVKLQLAHRGAVSDCLVLNG